MFKGSNSWSSTNFPATIWLTNFAGTGENPGPTTNCRCKIGNGANIVAPTTRAGRAVLTGLGEADWVSVRIAVKRWYKGRNNEIIWSTWSRRSHHGQWGGYKASCRKGERWGLGSKLTRMSRGGGTEMPPEMATLASELKIGRLTTCWASLQRPALQVTYCKGKYQWLHLFESNFA